MSLRAKLAFPCTAVFVFAFAGPLMKWLLT
jgi:hypothetical protein